MKVSEIEFDIRVPEGTYQPRAVKFSVWGKLEEAIKGVVDAESRTASNFKGEDSVWCGMYYTPKEEYPEIKAEMLSYSEREKLGEVTVNLPHDVWVNLITSEIARFCRAIEYNASHDAYGKEKVYEPIRCDWMGKDYGGGGIIKLKERKQ